MANTYSFNPQPTQSPPKPIFVRRTVNGFSTNLGEWLEANEPRTFDELMDLRRALYSQHTHGIYRIRNHGEAGKGSFVLVGLKGKLLLEYDKPRYYLLRQLNRLSREKGWPPLTAR